MVRDGSASIDSAVAEHWPEGVQQECLIHMHRHTRDKLRNPDRADFDRHCKNLREAEGREAGEEMFDELVEFLAERNAAAALVIAGRRDNLLAFHRLDVTSTLNYTFLNTDCIENALRNWREATGNVKRWSERKDMVSRWMASGMLWAEAASERSATRETSGCWPSRCRPPLRPPRYARRPPIQTTARNQNEQRKANQRKLENNRRNDRNPTGRPSPVLTISGTSPLLTPVTIFLITIANSSLRSNYCPPSRRLKSIS